MKGMPVKIRAICLQCGAKEVDKKTTLNKSNNQGDYIMKKTLLFILTFFLVTIAGAFAQSSQDKWKEFADKYNAIIHSDASPADKQAQCKQAYRDIYDAAPAPSICLAQASCEERTNYSLINEAASLADEVSAISFNDNDTEFLRRVVPELSKGIRDYGKRLEALEAHAKRVDAANQQNAIMLQEIRNNTSSSAIVRQIIVPAPLPVVIPPVCEPQQKYQFGNPDYVREVKSKGD